MFPFIVSYVAEAYEKVALALVLSTILFAEVIGLHAETCANLLYSVSGVKLVVIFLVFSDREDSAKLPNFNPNISKYNNLLSHFMIFTVCVAQISYDYHNMPLGNNILTLLLVNLVSNELFRRFYKDESKKNENE